MPRKIKVVNIEPELTEIKEEIPVDIVEEKPNEDNITEENIIDDKPIDDNPVEDNIIDDVCQKALLSDLDYVPKAHNVPTGEDKPTPPIKKDIVRAQKNGNLRTMRGNNDSEIITLFP